MTSTRRWRALAGVAAGAFVAAACGGQGELPQVKGVMKLAWAPIDVAVHPRTGRAYVAASRFVSTAEGTERIEGALLVIDERAEKLLATVAVGPNADAVAVDPGTDRIYVLSSSSDADVPSTLAVIDGTANRVVSTLPLVGLTGGMALQAAAQRVYVSTSVQLAGEPPISSNRLLVIDAASNRLIQGVEISRTTDPASSRGLALNTATDRIHLGLQATSAPGALVVIDRETLKVLSTTPARDPESIAVGRDNRVFSSANVAKAVEVFDGDGRLLKTLPTDSRPIVVAVDEEKNLIYFSNRGTEGTDDPAPAPHANTIGVLDAASGKVIGYVPVSVGPFGIAVDFQRNRIYVVTNDPESGSGTLSVLE